MVVKVSIETVALNITDKKEKDENQTQLRKYIRTYYPKWL